MRDSKLRPEGSAGGHHGLESVIESLGSDAFPRLRVGVRSAAMPQDLAGYVLEKFSADGLPTVGETNEAKIRV